jgi:hypothetical protein
MRRNLFWLSDEQWKRIEPHLPTDVRGVERAIWICQFVGREIRLLDYIEGVGQPLGYYAEGHALA